MKQNKKKKTKREHRSKKKSMKIHISRSENSELWENTDPETAKSEKHERKSKRKEE